MTSSKLNYSVFLNGTLVQRISCKWIFFLIFTQVDDMITSSQPSTCDPAFWWHTQSLESLSGSCNDHHGHSVQTHIFANDNYHRQENPVQLTGRSRSPKHRTQAYHNKTCPNGGLVKPYTCFSQSTP